MSDHPDPRAALRSAWHLAVVAGPDTGWCLGLGPEPAEVGRGAADLPLSDPLVSRQHLQVRERRGRVEARDHGSANGTRWHAAPRSPWRRRRDLPRRLRHLPTLPPRWRELPQGARLQLGSTILEVRRRPAELRPPAAPEPARAPERRDWVRLALPLLACLTMVPLLLSTAAGPWRWAVLALPLFLVVAAVVGTRRSRAPELPDPATVLLHTAAAGGGLPPGEALRAGVTAAGEEIVLDDGDRVALVGRTEHVAAAARWLVCQLATWHGDLVVDLPQEWEWSGPRRRLGPVEAPRRLTVHLAPGADRPPPGVGAAARGGGGSGPDASVHLVLAGSLQAVPPWCTRVVPVRHAGVSEAWSAAVAALRARTDPEDRATLPSRVRLADLLGAGPVDHPDGVRRQWAVGRRGLAAPLGVSEAGPVEVDLVAHGPHALLAGTTGSGKSELLLAWLLALAVRHPPDRLQLVLVDYKGGATFAGLAGLPHTAGVLTDLEPASTTRALTSLRAEVLRRERLLADAGAKDLAAFLAARPAERLPRLLVVVDEFRVLADTHPEVLAALVRLAAQGRSLGIHLVLATQRPGSAVGADVRANLTVRICLRVLEAAESQDVVGTADAAALPPVPGRALVRTDRLRTVQAPWCGDDRWAQRVVRAVSEAWADGADAGLRDVPGRPWAPPLPRRLALTDLPATCGGLVLGRSDLPEEQRLGLWAWDPSAMLVVGGPGTGRTETLRTVVAAALRTGTAVHVLAAEPHRFADLRGPTTGTVSGAEDPRRAARLLELIKDATGPQLLVVDDVESVTEQLDLVSGPGQGLQLLARALRDGRRAGVAAVLSGPPSLLAARWAESVRTRLVLAPRDESEALLAGVPRGLHGGDPVPGRGVLVEPGRATAVQVALAGAVDLGPARSGILRVAPLPERVGLDELGKVTGPAGGDVRTGGPVLLGRGGDDGGPVSVSCVPGTVLLVVGPPGSGRTSTLAMLRQQLGGSAVAVAGPDHVTGPDRITGPDDVPAQRAVLLLDDVDRWPSPALDELERRLASRPDLAVVAAARPEPVVGAYRGPLATWRATADLVLLRPSHPATAQLTDVDLSTAADPGRPMHPGRGVLVTRGRAVALQVAMPGAGAGVRASVRASVRSAVRAAGGPATTAVERAGDVDEGGPGAARQTTVPGARVPEA